MSGIVLDLFAGAGGWDEGLRLAGHAGPVVGIEWDAAACATGQAAGHQRIRADVAAYPTAPFVGKVAGLLASPPCPSFSTAGTGGGKIDLPNVARLIADYARDRVPGRYEWADERSALTAQPMRWAVALRPRWIACEQVPPVLPIWRYTAAMLCGLGYQAWCGVLSAEEYATPQTRRRAFLLASLDGPVGPPVPTHQPYRRGREPRTEPDPFGGLLPPPVSMAEALGWTGIDRPARTIVGARAPRWAYGEGDRSYATGWTLRSNYGTSGDSTDRGERCADEPAATVTGKANRNLWMAPAGAASKMIDPRPDTVPAGVITGKGTAAWMLRNGSQDNACVRGLDEPAGTVFFSRRGNAADWVRDQPSGGSVRVTVQEAAILQGFRADYPWRGTKTQRYQQVGNAVPPPLAAAALAPLLALTASERAA